jgi:hypothetical protein
MASRLAAGLYALRTGYPTIAQPRGPQEQGPEKLPAQTSTLSLPICSAARTQAAAGRKPDHLSLPLLPVPSRGSRQDDEQTAYCSRKEKGQATAEDRSSTTAACTTPSQPQATSGRRDKAAGPESSERPTRSLVQKGVANRPSNSMKTGRRKRRPGRVHNLWV